MRREPIPLGGDDDREVSAAGVPLANVIGDLLDRHRHLGRQDHVGASRDPRGGCDPACASAHDLDDHDAVVGLGGGVQPVDRFRADMHGGVESDRNVRAGDVVVDRLRDADDGKPVLREEAMSDPQRSLAADRDDAIELEQARRLDTSSTPCSSRKQS